VFDPDAPSTRRVLAQLEKKDVRNNLMKLAKWRARSQHEAEDLVQEALLVVCDPEKKPWPEGVGFLSHMRRFPFGAITGRLLEQSVAARRARS
jgi:hypothetical protein